MAAVAANGGNDDAVHPELTLREVRMGRIAPRSREVYRYSSQRFISWLRTSHPEVICPRFRRDSDEKDDTLADQRVRA